MITYGLTYKRTPIRLSEELRSAIPTEDLTPRMISLRGSAERKVLDNFFNLLACENRAFLEYLRGRY